MTVQIVLDSNSNGMKWKSNFLWWLGDFFFIALATRYHDDDDGDDDDVDNGYKQTTARHSDRMLFHFA